MLMIESSGMNTFRKGKAATDSELDRRRPGRRDAVNPALVPLLRGEAEADGQDRLEERQFGDPDQMRSVTGVATGVVISIGIWAALIMGLRWLFF